MHYGDLLPIGPVTAPPELVTPSEHWSQIGGPLRNVVFSGAGTQTTPVARVDEIGGVLSHTMLSFGGSVNVSSGPPILVASTEELFFPGTKLNALVSAGVGASSFQYFWLSESVGKVLAMGYEPNREVLVVLSAPGYSRTSSSAGGASHFRLLAIDANGSVEQWALIPRNVSGNGSDLRYAISTTPAGGIVVVRSGNSSNGTNLVHLTVTQHGIRADVGHVSAHDMPTGVAPIAGEEGVSFVAFDGAPPAETMGFRYEDMTPIAIEELGDFL